MELPEVREKHVGTATKPTYEVVLTLPFSEMAAADGLTDNYRPFGQYREKTDK